MIDYKSRIIEILKKSNGLPLDNVEVGLLKSLDPSEKREYKFELFFTALYELEKDGVIFRGRGRMYKKGKFYFKKPED